MAATMIKKTYEDYDKNLSFTPTNYTFTIDK